jgi:proteasome accessory factor C
MSGRTVSRLARILAMVPYVLAHGGATVSDLSERFGYTRKELVDDLQIVFLCGLPGYGPGDLIDADVYDDEVFINTADYFGSAPRLSPNEGLALLAAGLAVIDSGQAGPELESAVEKLTRTLLPDEDSAILDVDLAGEPELVSRLRQAAAAGEVLQITYTSMSRDQTTVRQIEPQIVFTSMGNWYVQAHCRLADGLRQFRVDRIRAIDPTEERFVPPKDAMLPEVRYTPLADDVRCRIVLHPSARWVSEYYAVDVVEDNGADLVIDFATADPNVAARLLLRLGRQADLVSGPEVAESLARLRQRVLALYEA